MSEPFVDRRATLFGRAKDVRKLLDRAREPGLTAVTGRPRMGKSWTLTEVARQLIEEGGHLVGYHEFKGSETSHLLRAVSDLYVRWLSDSTLREQAQVCWEQHTDNLVPRIGQLVGTLFGKLGKTVLPEPILDLVTSTFDSLAQAQEKLASGGLTLAPLPYDQAHSLVQLVSTVSKRRVVLILDAAEKSLAAVHSEQDTLDSFLKHVGDWHGAHLFLGVRNPEVNPTAADERAYQDVAALCDLYPSASLYPLPPLDQDPAAEGERIIEFVRDKIPAARGVDGGRILDLVSGYPGVLDQWTGRSVAEMHSAADLQRVADDAQSNRYPELERLLSELLEPALKLAARLAFLPALDGSNWSTLREVLLQDQTEAVLDALIDARVLEDEAFPSYGHDTRHGAVRRWFVNEKKPLMRRTAQHTIEALAAKITGINAASTPYYEMLTGCSETARKLSVDSVACCLLDAARSAYGECVAILHEEFDRSFPLALGRNRGFAPLIGNALYSRGVTKGQRGDSGGAITDYSALIELPDAPAEPVSKALNNRGITKGQRGDREGAIADYSAAIELPDAPAEPVSKALLNRGVSKGQHGDSDGAIADYSAAINLLGAPTEQVAMALYNRGLTKGQSGDRDGAIADYSAAIKLPGAPAAQVAKSLFNRGFTKGQRGDRDGAIADYSAVIGLPGVPAEVVAKALLVIGRVEQALALYRDLTGVDSPTGWLHWAPEIDLTGLQDELSSSSQPEVALGAADIGRLSSYRTTLRYGDVMEAVARCVTFLPTALLIECRAGTAHAPLIWRPNTLLALTGTSAALNTAQEWGWLSLETVDAAASYLRLFCRYVYATEGPFLIVEQASDIPWLHTADDAIRARVATLIQPLVCTGTAPTYHIEATVLYGNSLLHSRFAVSATASPNMISGETLHEDLAVRRFAVRDGWHSLVDPASAA